MDTRLLDTIISVVLIASQILYCTCTVLYCTVVKYKSNTGLLNMYVYVYVCVRCVCVRGVVVRS